MRDIDYGLKSGHNNFKSMQFKEPMNRLATKAGKRAAEAASYKMNRPSCQENPAIIFRRDQLVSYRCSAVDAGIVVFFSLRQNEEKSFSHPDRPLAVGAVKLCCVKILVGFLSHKSNVTINNVRTLRVRSCRRRWHQGFPLSLSGMRAAFSSHMAASLSLGAR